ncbi:MAG: nucleotide exchange factor GrpE [Caldilineaceae bacterium]
MTEEKQTTVHPEDTTAQHDVESTVHTEGDTTTASSFTDRQNGAAEQSEGTALAADAEPANAEEGATEDENPPEQPTEKSVEKSDAEVIAELQGKLAEMQSKQDELTDKLQRTAAEFQNSRRRQEKQVSDAIERASAHVVQRLLPVLDDLELAFQNTPATSDEASGAWLEGFRQIQKKLGQLLEDQGVSAIAPDGPFDPMRHEAVTSEPSDEVESGHIIQTLRTGYEHKGRVLRPALVRVAL